jgi:UDP-galactopyranose mutase
VSPTKTPEYLAGGKPVVSSPIPDVEADYGEVVAIADSVADFVAACEAAAASPPDPDALAAEAASRARSWDDIAGAMLGLVAEASRMRRSP